MSAESPSSEYMVKRTEFMVIAPEPDVVSVAKAMATFFVFNAEYVPSIESLESEARSKVSPVAVLISLLSDSSLEEKNRTVEKIRKMYARSHIVAAIHGKESAEDLASLRASGVQYFILHSEIVNTSKFYYLGLLLVQGTYLPVPVADFFPSTQVDFNGFHKMPINQNYLPVVFAGFAISDKKYRKLEPAKQIYIRREELDKYRAYIESYHDNRGNALKKRCRATLMNLMGLYTELQVLLSLDGQLLESSALQNRIEGFCKVANDLGEYLKDCPDAWNVIAQSLDFQFCRYERGPYILAYAMYIANRIGLPSVKDIVLSVLFTDLGILELQPVIFEKLQQNGFLNFDPSEQEKYQHHPVTSLNRVMARQLELSNEVKSILVCTHERADEKGFPNQVPKDKLPVEAQLILFCQVLDRRVKANLSEGLMTHDFIRKQVWEEEKVSLACFQSEFLDKIEAVVITPVA